MYSTKTGNSVKDAHLGTCIERHDEDDDEDWDWENKVENKLTVQADAKKVLRWCDYRLAHCAPAARRLSLNSASLVTSRSTAMNGGK